MYAHYMQNSAADCGIASLKTMLKQLQVEFEGETELFIKYYSLEKNQGLSLEELKGILVNSKTLNAFPCFLLWEIVLFIK